MRIVIPHKELRVYLGIRIEAALKSRLEAAAKRDGVTLTAEVEQLVAWALARHEKEQARRARGAA